MPKTTPLFLVRNILGRFMGARLRHRFVLHSPDGKEIAARRSLGIEMIWEIAFVHLLDGWSFLTESMNYFPLSGDSTARASHERNQRAL